MKTLFIGRQKEKRQLRDFVESTSARFVGILGQRKLWKTYLSDTYFENFPSFKVVGKHKANNGEQLSLFRVALQKAFFDGANLPEFTSYPCVLKVVPKICKKRRAHKLIY